MKGEYVDHHHHHHQIPPPKHELQHTTTAMFSKPHGHHHHPHHHHQQPQPQQQQLPFTQHFHLSRDTATTDDTSEPNPTTPTIPSSSTTTTSAAVAVTNINSTDGATIEVVRRPRGRPPGSKNKQRPPVVITREPEPAMSPYILELPGGCDVVESLTRFCRRKNMGLCVLTGTGAVANVTLRQPSTAPHGATITFHGRFDILSISATVFPQQTISASATCPPNTFTISLAGPQGQIVGGLVAGGLIAAGTVYVIAASFNKPSFHRLTAGGGSGGDEEGRSTSGGGGGGGGGGQSPVSGSGGCGGGVESGHNAPGVESGMYSSHGLGGSDVLWSPTARPTQQPPPY